MRRMLLSLLVFAVTWAFASQTVAMEWGPWSSNSKAPVIGDKRSFPARPVISPPSLANPASQLLIGGVRFFQKHISKVDGDRCFMTPTCSDYSLQAIRKHGPFLGFAMTADRIVHEYEEQRFVPAIWIGRGYRFLDPVENNDFWFPDSPRSED